MHDPSPHVMTIFGDALEQGSPERRASFVEGACGGDAELRGRVEALLPAHDRAGNLLGGSDDTAVPHDPLGLKPETSIGPYKLLEPIGEGGFGVVVLAEQTEPVRRKVALKVIKPGMDSRQVIARFEAERQALAL